MAANAESSVIGIAMAGIASLLPASGEKVRMRGGAIGRDGEANVQAPHSRLLPASGDDIQTSSSVGGHIGPAPSSRFAAAALRFARFAVTAPRRCGEV
jgi:hypothetical protein